MNLPSMAYVVKANELLANARPFNERNIPKLEELKKTMMWAGFASPFKGLLKKTMEEAEELSEAEWADLKKQVSYFRYIANLKRFTLSRVSIALDAHKVSKKFVSMGYTDVAEHTPLDGSHISLLMDAGAEGILAYKELMDRIEDASERRKVFGVRVKVGEETFSATFDEPENIERDVVRKYGINAEILSVRPVFKRTPIISSKGVRVALASAIVNYVSKHVGEGMKKEEESVLRKYNDVLREKGIRPDVRMDKVEGFGEVKEELVKKKLMEKKGGSYKLKKGLGEELAERRKRKGEEVTMKSSLLLLSPMLKFYITTSEEGRKRKNLYPSLSIFPQKTQMGIFAHLEEIDRQLPARKILKKKLELEGMKLPIKDRALGAALLLKESGKDADWVSRYLGMSPKEAETAAKMFERIEKGGRGSAFLKKAS